MTETVCARIKLNPGSLPKVDAWAEAMNARPEEVVDALVDEGVSLEPVFLERTSEGDFLIYFMRAESLRKSAEVTKNSTREVDAIHKAFKAETFGDREILRPLIDFSVGDGKNQ